MKMIVQIIGILAVLAAGAQAQPDANLRIFPESISTVDNVTAGFVNPAGLALPFVMGFRYMHAYSDSSLGGDDGVILATRGNLVSIQWLKNGDGIFRRKYLLAGGKRLVPRLYWGISYAWFGGSNEKYRKKKTWTIGFLYFARNDLSIGWVVDDLNRPKFGEIQTERQYSAGATYSMLHGKANFSADFAIGEKSNLKKTQSRFRLEVTPVSYLKIAADYSDDGYFRIGLAGIFGYIDMGFGNEMTTSKFAGGNFYYNQGPVRTKGE